MHQPQEQFESVRRVLIIKRYEAPPPGYFNHFADKIVARIESENLVIENSWWRRFLNGFDAKPIVASAYTVGLGGLLLVGLSLVRVYDQDRTEDPTSPSSWAGTGGAVPFDSLQTRAGSEPEPMRAQIGFASSVNPVISSEVPAGMFSTPSMNHFGLRYQPASFSISGQ